MPAGRDRPGAGALRRPALAGAPGRRADRAGGRALPQPEAAEGNRAGPGVGGDRGRRSPSAAAPGTSSPAPTCSSPTSPSSTSASSPAPGATNSGGSRSTPSAKSRCSATAPAPTSSPGTSCATTRSRYTEAHSLFLEAFAELGLVGGLLVLALVGTLLWTGFAAWRAARRALSGSSTRSCSRSRWPSPSAPRSTGSGRSPVLGAIFFLASGVLVAGRCAQLAQAARLRQRQARGAALRPRRRRAGDRLDHRARAGRAAAGRPRDQGQPGGGRRRRPRQRRQPRRHGPHDRALGGLALRPAGTARPSPGRLRDRLRAAGAGDRPRGPQLGSLLPALQGRTRSGEPWPPPVATCAGPSS